MYKKIGNSIYIHKSNLKELEALIDKNEFKQIYYIKENLLNDSDFAIIKYNKKDKKVSFIASEDWDISREPIVGDSYTTNIYDIKLKIIKSKGQIYHHKWMFVSDDYKGFNIEESKQWSEQWTNVIPNNKAIKSRIGYKKYWIEILKQYNLDIE